MSPITSRSLRILLLIVLLIGSAGVAPRSGRTSSLPGKSPIRLRLKAENNTLPSGRSTKISAEFLDRDYQPVANDGTRLVEFGITAPGSGAFSPRQVTARPGAWSADTTFSSAQPGKIMITARTDGLDSAQTILLVTRPAASFLSQLLDPVAYAQPFDGFELLPSTLLEMPANNNAKATFLVTFSEPPPAGTKIRVSVNPPATLMCEGKNQGAVTEIRFREGEGISDPIDVVSGTPATVDVKAIILSRGDEKHLSVKFTPPHPARIVFGDDLGEIRPYESTVLISLQLADESGKPLSPDKPRSIVLSSEGPVDFDPPSVSLAPNRSSVESKLRLNQFPITGELKVFAEYKGDDSLKSGQKTIIVRSVIEKVIVTGPREVARGNTSTQFSVRLADKDGKSRSADWNRKINLSVSSGTLSQTQVTIPKGQDAATVQYVPADSTGKVLLKAESGGLTDGSVEIVLVTALYWLVISALLGGLLGGVVRHVLKDYKLERVLPQRVGEFWELGLVGRILGSIVSGLFLYLTFKVGVARIFGLPELPAALDLGTKLVAFYFAGIGGFAGTLVFDKLASIFRVEPSKDKVQAQPAT